MVYYSQTQESLLKLKCSCIELVEVMVEETSKHSPQLGKWVFSHLTLRNFLFAMKEIWDEYTSLLHITNKDYLQKSVFRAYHVLRRVADYKNVTINTLGIIKLHLMSIICNSKLHAVADSIISDMYSSAIHDYFLFI